LAQAISKILDNPAKYYGKIFELAGGKIYSLSKILTMVQSTTNKNCYLLETPNKLSMVIAFLCELLPKPIFTRDQIRLLRYDNIIFNNNLSLTFKDLGIIPKSLEEMMYLYKMNKKNV
jgi:NADH dehydrogenase